MKVIKLLVSLLLLLSLFGCNKDTGTTTRNGETFNKYDGYEIPASFGESILADKDIDNIVNPIQEINNIVDAFRYIKINTFDDSRKAVEKCGELLFEDYDELGELVISDYSLLSVKINGKYYPIDVFSNEKTWMSSYKLDSYSFDSKENMCKALNAEYKNLVVFNNERIVESEKYGTKIYTYKGFEIPVALGYPKITDEQMSEIDDMSAPLKITTYADALVYLYNNLYGVYAPTPINRMANDGEITGAKFMNDYCQLLFGDYKEVYNIYNITNGPVGGKGGCTFFLVLKAQDNKYYWLDWYQQVIFGDKKWLGKYIDNEFTGDKYCFDSIDELCQAMKDPSINAALEYHVDLNTFKPDVYLLADESYAELLKKETQIITLPDGEEVQTYYKFGAECYKYCGTDVPVELGLPKLTTKEIDELITSKDYERIKDEITTYADMALYCLRAKYRFTSIEQEDLIGFQKATSDNWFNILPAKQTMAYKFGSCTTATNLFNYLLKDDYDELGIVQIRYKEGGGHTQAYLKSNGKYFMVNPSSTFFMDPANTTRLDLWMKEYDMYDVAYGDSLQEIIDGLVNSKNPGTPHVTVDQIYIVYTDYDFVYKADRYYSYPEDFEASVVYGSDIAGVATPSIDYKNRDRKDEYDISKLDDIYFNNID